MATKTKVPAKPLTFEERKQKVRNEMQAVSSVAAQKRDVLQKQFDAIEEEERLFDLRAIHANVDLLLQFAEHSESDGNDEDCVRHNSPCSEYCPRCALLLLKKLGVDGVAGNFTIRIDYDE